MARCRIAGIGKYLPPRVVPNEELAALMDTTDEWIQARSGIKERRFAADDVGSTELGVLAARDALQDAGWQESDIEFIIFATLSPDLYFPGNGVLLGRDLGLEGIGALDVRNQCTGFVYGLSVADAFIRMGLYGKILLVGAECHSAGLRLDDIGRDTAVLFGDGGGAMCLESAPDDSKSSVLWHKLHADGRYAEELWVPEPGSRTRPWISSQMIEDGRVAPLMNGREVFRHAITKFPAVIEEVIESQGFTKDDVRMIVPHQANLRITEAVIKRLGVQKEKVYSNIERYGNTTAASIPIAMKEAVEEGKIKRGDLVCLASFGSGFTWAASLLRY